MTGLGVAALIAIISIVLGRDWPAVYKRVTGFLFFWYLVVAVLISVGMGMFLVGAGFVGGFMSFGPLGALFGSMAGGVATLFVVLWVSIAYVLQITGAKLLKTALVSEGNGAYSWNHTRSFVGFVFILVGAMLLPMLS